MKKKGRKIFMILGVILSIIIGLMLIGYVVNKIATKKAMTNIKPHGQIVEVDGGKMHIYSEGNGEETIVLLSGYGVSLPCDEFAPLIDELKEDYTVVVCDYMGTGFSSGTDKPRTNENIVNETRESLKKAGFEPPYILMPHSISGIYSQYFANKYPEEVSSIIMLDTTPSIVMGGNPPKFVLKIAQFTQAIGLSRFQLKFFKLPYTVENGYTQEEISHLREFACNSFNSTVVNQGADIYNNIKEVEGLAFPSNIPVLKLISKQQGELTEKQLKEPYMVSQEKHLDMLGDKVEYKIIDASHMLYHTNSKEIKKYTDEFLNQYVHN